MLQNSSSEAKTQAGGQPVPQPLWKLHSIIVILSKYKCVEIILILWLSDN
jgi:hypothetical protein